MPNDIKTQNFYWLPILKEEIWDELQNKNYQRAGDNFRDALKTIPPTEWQNTFWIGIIKGFPFLRAGLSEKEWSENVLPLIARAVLSAASGEALVNVFRNLDVYPELFKSFKDLIVAAIPGENDSSKIAWLKTNKTSLYTFFVANLGQELGIGVFEVHFPFLDQTIERYGSLPQTIKNEILSYATAEDVFRVGNSNHLSPEKISGAATIAGRVLMGFLHTDDIAKELQVTLNIDNRLAQTITEELERKIFSGLSKDIRGVYDPITVQVGKETRPEEKRIVLGTIGDEDITAPISTKAGVSETIRPEKQEMPSEGKPLIIHQEEGPPAQAGKKPFKGLEFPFGFFGKEGEAAPAEPVRVRVETPKEKRVVHYSELRTPLAPFQKPEEIINLETFGRKPQEVKAPVPEAPIKVETTKPEPKPQPKIEGNVVDLSE